MTMGYPLFPHQKAQVAEHHSLSQRRQVAVLDDTTMQVSLQIVDAGKTHSS
jgi:hypothetical protein